MLVLIMVSNHSHQQMLSDPMEGMRLVKMHKSAKGLMAHPFLGMTGSPVIIPGAMDPRDHGPRSTVDATHDHSRRTKQFKERS